MNIRMAVPALAALTMAFAAWAQSTSSAPALDKVAVINIQAAIAGTAEGKQAAAQVQAQFAPRQSELQTLQKQIEEVRARLQTGQTTLSDEEKARLAREGDQLTRALQRRQQDAQDDYNDATQEVVATIGRKMIGILDDYAKKNGYSVILDTSSQQTAVLYAANQIDITQDIIRLYDQSYPVKTAAAPAKPAATRPAAAARRSATKP